MNGTIEEPHTFLSTVLNSALISLLRAPQEANAFPFVKQGAAASKVIFVTPDKNATDSLQDQQSVLDDYTLNSELLLLKLLPVKNPVFRGLERSVVGLSSLKSTPGKSCKDFL